MIHELEDLRSQREIFQHFMEVYLSVFIGRLKFKKELKTKRLSEIVSASDEAFALLILKNNCNAWPQNYQAVLANRESKNVRGNQKSTTEKDKNDEEDGGQSVCSSDSKKSQTMYTTIRKTKGSHKLGWSNEGLEKFSEYYEKVKEDRKTDEGVALEKDIMQMYVAEGLDELDNKRMCDEEEIETPNDWDTFVDNSNIEHEIDINQESGSEEEESDNESDNE